MVFFLMAVMAIIFIGITLSTFFLSFYKQGALLQRKGVFFTLTGLIFVELIISLTSLPLNFIAQKGLVVVLMLMLMANSFIYSKSFKTSRLVLSFLALTTLLSLFFI